MSEGDVVAWGTTWGRSPALCVARIAKIRYFTRFGRSYGTTKECDRDQAEGYNLVLEPLKSTGSITLIKADGDSYYEHRDGPRRPDDGVTAKRKTIQHVKNVVKLDVQPDDIT